MLVTTCPHCVHAVFFAIFCMVGGASIMRCAHTCECGYPSVTGMGVVGITVVLLLL